MAPRSDDPARVLDGAWADALHYVEAGEDLLIQAGQPANMAFLLASRALVDAHLGRVEAARRSAERAFELSEQTNACSSGNRFLGARAPGALARSTRQTPMPTLEASWPGRARLASANQEKCVSL